MTKTQISNKKLKAIVFTDIVNFTKLSAEDEQHALNIIDKQREIVKPIVEKHNGEWLKEIGDGLLFSFDSSLDAVNCSIEIQQSLKNIEDFKIRIGIHQGDIFIKDGDVFGDDVNIASRVESFAPEGGIAISDKVSKDIAGVKEIKTSFVGYKKLKGVEQETQIKAIISHDIPNNKGFSLTLIAAYICFFFASFSFLGWILPPLLNQINNLLLLETFSITKIFSELYNNYDIGIKGLTYLFIGYSALSYTRGISLHSQRLLTYLAYIYILSPFLYSFSNRFRSGFTEWLSMGAYNLELLILTLALTLLPITLFILYRKIKSKSRNIKYWIFTNLFLSLLILFFTYFIFIIKNNTDVLIENTLSDINSKNLDSGIEFSISEDGLYIMNQIDSDSNRIEHIFETYLVESPEEMQEKLISKKTFNKEGKLIDHTYRVDSLNIKQIGYYPSGNIKGNVFWVDTTLKGNIGKSLLNRMTLFHENRQVNVEAYIFYKYPRRTFYQYDRNGNSTVKEGNGIYYTWDEIGEVSSEVPVVDSLFHGEYLTYYTPNSIHNHTSKDSSHLSNKANYVKGLKHGESLYYRLDGSIKKREIYDSGELIETFKYKREKKNKKQSE